MQWNVIKHNVNSDRIESFNVFEHYRFNEDAQKHLKKCKTKEEFAEKLKSDAMYYFWSKAEYEVIVFIEDDRVFIMPWVGSRDPYKMKVDVTEETGFDWKGFAEYNIGRQIYQNEAKIDIYDQLRYRWDDFVTYCWNNRFRGNNYD